MKEDEEEEDAPMPFKFMDGFAAVYMPNLGFNAIGPFCAEEG